MQLKLRVTTPTKEIEFECNASIRARSLFQDMCKNIGVRETWYFGLYYLNEHREKIWIDQSKKKMNIYKHWATKLLFNIKFYPEDVTSDLIEDLTIKFFFLEMRNEILFDRVYCPPGTCFLLASYAAQAKYNDYTPESDISNTKMLPERVYKQHNMEEQNILENVVNLWKNLRGLLREDAMLEYLKLTQNLEMFGVHFFKIKNPKGTSLLLGVYALGLNIYSPEDKLNPKINFPWSEIADLAFKGKKFIIKCRDKSATTSVFFSEDPKLNKRILNLGIGYHQLYIRRRKGDSLEILEMREHAQNHRKMLHMQRDKLLEEIRTREAIEKKYKENLRVLQDEVDGMHKKLLESQALIEKLNKQLAENEVARRDLERRQMDLQQMMERLEEAKSLEASERLKLEEEILRKQREVQEVQEAVQLKDRETQRLQEEVERAKREQEELKAQQLVEAARREEELREAARLAAEQEVIPEINEINDQLKKQLDELQLKLEASRNTDFETTEDRIHRDNLNEGRDKYRTLKEIRQGNTTRRVDLFENL